MILRDTWHLNGKLTTTAYFSNRNLPEATIDAMGYRTTYAFDQQSRLVSTRDANGGYVTNTYDTVGRLSVVQNQLGENARQYGYDLGGRIVTMADAANRVRSYTFDAAGQNTATMFPDGKIATFAYDKVGRRTTMVDWGGTSTYSFDALGRQNGQTDAAGFVQSYGYDPNGNRTGLNLVGTGLFTYAFDSLNRLATAQKPGNALYTLSYDADSRRTTMMLGNGSIRKYAFDSRSQLTAQVELNASNVPIVTLIDSYDAVGNRMTRSVNGTVSTWTYDDLYRLTGQMKPGQVATYTLDGVGNLKVMWEGGSFPKTFAFNPADRLVTMIEGVKLTTYSYSGYGALEVEQSPSGFVTHTYSGQDQLIGTVTGSGLNVVRSTYTFGGDGLRRTAQNGNVQPTTMVWDGSDYLLLNGPSSNQVVLTLGSEIVSCGDFDLLPDSLGSVIGDIRAGLDPRLLVEYWPYGTRSDGTGARPGFPFLYVGSLGYYNDSAERDYVRARELHKKLGVWMQVDPLWPHFPAEQYAVSSPVTVVDSSGHRPQKQGPPRLFRGGEPGKCWVRVCTAYGFADDNMLGHLIPTHVWVCANTLSGRLCSAGFYSQGFQTDDMYPCTTGTHNGFPIKCRTVSTDCRYASYGCKCITKALTGGVPNGEYQFLLNDCRSGPSAIIRCICALFTSPGDQFDCMIDLGLIQIPKVIA